MKFSIRDFFSKLTKCADLVTLTEEILNGKPYFLCSVYTLECLIKVGFGINMGVRNFIKA